MNREEKNVCLYRHIRLDNNNVFYIGIGYNKRAYSRDSRNKHWLNTVSITEYEVQILKSDLSWKEACELEKILISYYGRRDLKLGTLVNMTNGGEGSFGRIPSEETRKKLGNGKHNNKWWVNRTHSEESRIKISNTRKGRCQKNTEKKVKDNDNNLIYTSCKKASIALNISESTLTYHLRTPTSKFNVEYYHE